MSAVPRTRDCRFSSVRSGSEAPSNRSPNESNIGFKIEPKPANGSSIGTSAYRHPIRSASSFASSSECCDEYFPGSAMPVTLDAPIALAAITAVSAESIPPESPRQTDLKPVFRK